MFKVMDIFIRVGVEVSHDNYMESIFDSSFDIIDSKLAKIFAFSKIIVFLKTVKIYNFEFFVRKIEVSGNKSATISMDLLDVFRNEISKNKADTTRSIRRIKTPIRSVQISIL